MKSQMYALTHNHVIIDKGSKTAMKAKAKSANRKIIGTGFRGSFNDAPYHVYFTDKPIGTQMRPGR